MAPAVPAPATPLPPNWIAKVIQPADLDKIPWLEAKDVGEILYRNTETKETTWEKPETKAKRSGWDVLRARPNLLRDLREMQDNQIKKRTFVDSDDDLNASDGDLDAPPPSQVLCVSRKLLLAGYQTPATPAVNKSVQTLFRDRLLRDGLIRGPSLPTAPKTKDAFVSPYASTKRSGWDILRARPNLLQDMRGMQSKEAAEHRRSGRTPSFTVV